MSRDPKATKASLLAAARVEFAAHGAAGARVDRIAERAGVSKERIYGYFGSKEKLFDAVLDEVVDEVLEFVGAPGKDIGAYVRRVHDFHRQQPELVRLLVWEGMQGGGFCPNRRSRVEHYVRKNQAMADALGLETAEEAAPYLFMFMAMCSWPVVVPQVARLVLGEDVDTEDGRDRLRKHIGDFAQAAVSHIHEQQSRV
ncbi:TetR/AcrR family transcriptional regulator [Allokutzneria albata]|uniref:DNA-binding transcriptional regulator, AcrR family n=1 Tax=Allokutzneria albata TaxID=211114 RepID=A0A1G9ZLK3_ALLAB|nr:TetR family transcriptional regulator [Allokutzneria albata]SDN21413.1 DNA-binding transcriptional regulator, AcrR family [Allokutzneria albata]